MECKELTKIYKSLWAGRTNDVCALENISLSVGKGQIVGLIGPNGAGKTTLLNMIAGLIFPTEGCLTVCGHPARSMEARRSLAYVPERPAFLGRYSARAVLQFHGALLGLSRKAISTQIDKSIQRLHLQEFAGRPCSGFSQGMKQRLALAIALMNDPKILLLDEPSNGLDPIGIVQLRDLLKQLSDSGTTIVISSHRLGELEKLTSDYIFLYRGQVVSFADRISSDQAGRLRVELESNGNYIADKLLPTSKILGVSNTELIISISNVEDVPNVVRDLVKVGADITSVILQMENIEDVFLRLYNERN
ncbi:MAG: ABC transporter ATP-binding protein [Planctomycetota bacterium]